MKLSEVISSEVVSLNLSGTTKEEVLAEMVDLLIQSGAALQRQVILDALMEREGLGSTGIGHGVAIPHGRCAGISSPVVALGRTRNEVEFDSIDGKPARLFFLLVAPENGSSEHLHLLARIARLMKDPTTRDNILKASTPEAVMELIQMQEID